MALIKSRIGIRSDINLINSLAIRQTAPAMSLIQTPFRSLHWTVKSTHGNLRQSACVS